MDVSGVVRIFVASSANCFVGPNGVAGREERSGAVSRSDCRRRRFAQRSDERARVSVRVPSCPRLAKPCDDERAQRVVAQGFLPGRKCTPRTGACFVPILGSRAGMGAG